MATKTKEIASRLVLKHDIAANWANATNFVPKQGEIIVYDKDTTCSYERIKVGDGVTVVSALPFILDELVEVTEEEINSLFA